MSSSRASLSQRTRTCRPWRPCFRLHNSRSPTIRHTLLSKKWRLSKVSNAIRSKRRVYYRSSLNCRLYMRSKSRTSRKKTMRVSLSWKRSFSSWSKSETSRPKTGTRLKMSYSGHWPKVRWKIAEFRIWTRCWRRKNPSLRNFKVKTAKLASVLKVWRSSGQSTCPKLRRFLASKKNSGPKTRHFSIK